MSNTPRAASAQVELSTGETLSVTAFTARQLIMDDAVPDALADISAGIRELGEQQARRIVASSLGQRAVSETPDIEAIAEVVTAVASPAPLELLLKRCRKPLVALLRAAIQRPDSWWDGLDLDDFGLLAAAVFTVNRAQHPKLEAALAELLGNLMVQPSA